MTTRMILVVAVALAVAAGLLASVLIQRRAGGRRHRWLLGPLYRASRRPAVAVLLLAALYLGVRAYPGAGQHVLRHVVVVLLIASVAWLVLRALHIAERAAFSRLPGETRADRRIRRARTQIRPVRRLTSVVVTVVAMGLILTTFPAPLRPAREPRPVPVRPPPRVVAPHSQRVPPRELSLNLAASVRPLACGRMGSVDVVLAVVVAAANLAVAAVLLVRSRGGEAVPRMVGRPQPSPRLRAATHVCLGLGLGVGWLVKDVFPPHSTGDTVLFTVVRILLVAGLVTALLGAFRQVRHVRDEAAR
ncbi:hypothetical protein [Micromonospora orduensis]|uniref:hypothetical protein n=1 Tax=Micromonospora orduensis TaxID=1420891 RepID=UPI0033E4498B